MEKKRREEVAADSIQLVLLEETVETGVVVVKKHLVGNLGVSIIKDRKRKVAQESHQGPKRHQAKKVNSQRVTSTLLSSLQWLGQHNRTSVSAANVGKALHQVGLALPRKLVDETDAIQWNISKKEVMDQRHPVQ